MDTDHAGGAEDPVEGDLAAAAGDAWIPEGPISDRRLHQLIAAGVALTALVAGLLLLAHPGVRRALGDAAARVAGAAPATSPGAHEAVRLDPPAVGSGNGSTPGEPSGSPAAPGVAVRPDPGATPRARPATDPVGGRHPVPTGPLEGRRPSGPAPSPSATPSPSPSASPSPTPSPTPARSPTPRPTDSAPEPTGSPVPPPG